MGNQTYVPTLYNSLPSKCEPKTKNSEIKKSKKLSSKWAQKKFTTRLKNEFKENIPTEIKNKNYNILTGTKKKFQKPLLTAKEEKNYGKLVQQLSKIRILERYMIKLKGYRPSSAELAFVFKIEESKFLQLKLVCEEANRKMINCNLRLVISVAKKKFKKKEGIELHDLVIVGINGLSRAVEKFDPSRGYKFSTYAHWWIRQAVDRFVLEQRTIKVPIHLWEILSKIRKAQRALRNKLNREPSFVEIGDLLGLDPKRVTNIVKAYQDTESLDKIFKDNDENQGSIEEVLVFEINEIDEHEFFKAFEYSDTRVQKKIEFLLKNALTKRQEEIIQMRYGLDDGIPKTLDEIGQRFLVSVIFFEHKELKYL